MSEQEAKQALENILDQVQIGSDDCIMLGIDMSGLPLPNYPAELTKAAFREREKKWCAFILDTLLEKIGAGGTLLVPTYTYKCGKAGSIFYSEQTESEVGPFTEFFRTKHGVIRSLHPIFSISGIGNYAQAILQDTGGSAFGSVSPFARFEEYKVKFLCLGVEIKNAITYVHHLEQCYGSPHRYNKRFDVKVYENGNCIKKEWNAYVGYRGINYESDISSLQHGLDTAGLLIKTEWKGKQSHVATIDDVNKIGYALLKNNSYAFVNREMQLQFDDSFPSNLEDNDVSKLVVTAKGISDQQNNN